MFVNQQVLDNVYEELLKQVFVEAPGSPLFRQPFARMIATCIVGHWNDNYRPVVATVTSVHAPEVETFLRFNGKVLTVQTYPTTTRPLTRYECGDWGHQFFVGSLPQLDFVDVGGVQVIIAQEEKRERPWREAFE